MVRSARLVLATAATLALTGCTTLATPARDADDAAAHAWQGKQKNGYVGLSVDFATADANGESCLIVSLQNRADKSVVDTRVCDRDFAEANGKRTGAALFALPPGRYTMKTASLRLPGNFRGSDHIIDSRLQRSPVAIEVEPHGFVHLATVSVQVETSGSMRRTETRYAESVAFGRPDDGRWQRFASVLRPLPSHYLATNGEQREMSWSFLAE